ncbi:biosynthetic-type acetolactate synthase large subunit [Arenicella xantha]|uniref:Acetolactate synthase n=1 Tax=Arenicella xantha TaxID=644221 RepID=A0A395JM90_9GAMM|nr:biosynthetic-type acetolactate synthase large subunit [Arenicella xantha]RBP50967.1 acetolactate synthase large subunit [Arenicella xantha]
MQLTGADIVVQSLKEEGVEYVFGYPGGAALHIYDAFHRQDDVQHILVRHEQGATHAADGFARATGKPGVVMVTSGPGITNAITGIATAYMDSIPMVVLSGQVMAPLIGFDAFQEIDAVGISRPCVKHNFLIQNVEDIAATIKKAFHIATSGRPGPVLVDIPKDITAQLTEFIYPKDIAMRSYPDVKAARPAEIVGAVEAILNAKKPVVYTGGGVVLAKAQEELRDFVQTLGFPCTNTLMGLGAYPHNDPLFIGMLGMHGTYEANMAMHDADLIVALGARFDDRITGALDDFAPGAKILHVDIDPSVIDKNIKADIAIIGDVKQVLTQFNREIARRVKDINPELTKDWWKQIAEWQGLDSLWYEHSDTVIKPQYVVQKLHEVTGGDAYVTSDVGQHQMFAAQFYGFSDTHKWINSGGLGTMGFGLPAAMGVKLAFPDSDVACVTGEGSIQMCIQELGTCKQYGLPVKVINLNNRYLGMVRQWQEFNYEKRYSNSYMDSLPDFVALAEAYGHVGMQITKPSDVEGALREAFALKDRLVFMDFITDREENVYPMIEAGKNHHEMRLRPAK